jgi:hypothetical protein
MQLLIIKDWKKRGADDFFIDHFPLPASQVQMTIWRGATNLVNLWCHLDSSF